ncbi:hypothetical protein GGR51DRAFT_565636 [Nemania sp. FL0031]|nr:hypothetical protein GGR51DRAFT_565636 [Nemania sp. FL0031]
MSKEAYLSEENSRKKEDFDAAITNVVKAIEVNSGRFVDEAVQRGNIIRMRLERCQWEVDKSYLEEIISNARKASGMVPSTSPYRSFLLADLGYALWFKYINTKDAGALIEAIDATIQAINLGYEFEPGSCGDWDKIIEEAKEGISPGRKLLLPSFKGHHPELAIRLNRLNWMIEFRYRLGNNRLDLEAAIRIGNEASALIPPGHPQFKPISENRWPGREQALEIARLDHLAEGVSDAREKVTEASRDGPLRSLFAAVGSLRWALHNQYEKTFDVTVLGEAISTARKAVRVNIDIHPYLQQFLIPQERTTIQKSIFRKLWEIFFPEKRKRKPEYPEQDEGRTLALNLSTLSKMLQERYRVIGDPMDLDEAIPASRNAIRLSAYKQNKLSFVQDEARHLANMLLMRYEEFGKEEDKEQAMKLIPEIMNFSWNLQEHLKQRHRIMLIWDPNLIYPFG